jgi:dienelactone hydrolase
MKSIALVLLSAIVTLVSTLTCAPATAAEMRDEVVQVPIKDGMFTAHLTTRIYAPPGDGPFPLVVINHGKATVPAAMQKDDPFYFQAIEFVRRGYAVVVPIRAGFGSSGGTYYQPNCAFAKGARHWADSVQAAIDYARTLSYVDSAHIVVIGQSQGGLTSVALAERNLPGVLGIVDIAGGMQETHCVGGDEMLVNDFRELGRKSTVPVLFLYGDNDRFWGDGKLSRRFFDAYHEGNPNAQYFDEGIFSEGDSHMIFHRYSGVKIWMPPVRRFFESLGLTWEARYLNWHRGNTIALENIDIVPYQDVSVTTRVGLERFLRSDPRAGRVLAIASNGHYGFATGKDADARALKTCEEVGGVGCQVYARDNELVYGGPFATTAKTSSALSADTR